MKRKNNEKYCALKIKDDKKDHVEDTEMCLYVLYNATRSIISRVITHTRHETVRIKGQITSLYLLL